MTYNKSRPIDQDIGTSRPLLVENFTAIDDYIKRDHVDFDGNDPTAGRHTKVTLLEQVADPDPAADQGAIYTKAEVGVTELFFQRENSGTKIQMTDTKGDPVIAETGQSFLPGGIIMKWGIEDPVRTASTTITFAEAFPTACFMAQITPANAAAKSISVVDKDKAWIKAIAQVSTRAYWIAIGN